VREANERSAAVVLTPAESKRLIARAVVKLPAVRRALEKGRIIVALSTTNAFVAEELLGRPVPKDRYVSGYVGRGRLDAYAGADRLRPLVLVDGRPVDRDHDEVLREFTAGDVFVKSANAVDPAGYAGVLLGSHVGGTIGAALGVLAARGSHLVVPVGLEKLVPSVVEAARKCGTHRLAWSYGDGSRVGFMALVSGTVVTEIQAFEILCGVRATHVASGGIGGSEGSVVLVLEGSEAAVDDAFRLLDKIKGEAPVPLPGSGSG